MKTATVETTHDDAATVAAAVTPDNTDAMTTTVDGDTVRTTIERESAGGLAATLDDYLVNLRIAAQLSNTDTHDDT
jgi:hypothetical protein